jgi:hypothetical protein
MAVRFSRAVLAHAVAVLVAALPAEAQETASETLVAGQRAISIRPFSTATGGSVGIWRVTDESRRFGWMFNGSVGTTHTEVDDSLDASSTSVGFAVGPELRRYRDRDGRFAPFTFIGGSIGGSLQRNDPFTGDTRTGWSVGVGAHAGFGVEFFPVRNLGLDAQLGLEADAGYSPLDDDDVDGHRWHVGIGTYNASLGGSFYF